MRRRIASHERRALTVAAQQPLEINQPRASASGFSDFRHGLLGAILLAWGMAAPLPAQQFKIDLEHLAAKSSHVVDLSLNGSTLQFAARFLDGKDPDEAKVKRMMSGIEGIYIKSFEFDKEGQYTDADVESIREQLRGPGWKKMVNVRSKRDKENAEIYVLGDENNMQGLVILAAESKELTVVDIVGPIDLDTLSELGGHMGIPPVEVKKGGKESGDANTK